MKQSEFKKRYDPELGRFTRQHIYGEGVMDVFKNIGRRVFGQTSKKVANKAIKTAATNTGEHVGEKAGDKIIDFLSRKKKTQKPKKVTFKEPLTTIINSKPMTQQDRYQQLGLILSDD